MGPELKHQQTLVEALNQIVSKRGHLPSPDPLDTNSFRAQQHCRLDSPIRIFTLEMSEPGCYTVTPVQGSAVLPCRSVRICRFILGS
jgi:hypothetical protein